MPAGELPILRYHTVQDVLTSLIRDSGAVVVMNQDWRGPHRHKVRVGPLGRWTTSATGVHAFYLEFLMGMMVMVGQSGACDGCLDGNAG